MIPRSVNFYNIPYVTCITRSFILSHGKAAAHAELICAYVIKHLRITLAHSAAAERHIHSVINIIRGIVFEIHNNVIMNRNSLLKISHVLRYQGKNVLLERCIQAHPLLNVINTLRVIKLDGNASACVPPHGKAVLHKVHFGICILHFKNNIRKYFARFFADFTARQSRILYKRRIRHCYFAPLFGCTLINFSYNIIFVIIRGKQRYITARLCDERNKFGQLRPHIFCSFACRGACG